MEQELCLISMTTGSFRALDVRLPIPGAAEGDKSATLDTFEHGLGAYRPHALARSVYLHFVLSMLIDFTTESHRANERLGGSFLLPLEIQSKRLRVLELLEQHIVAGAEFAISPLAQPGDEILPVSQSLAVAPFGDDLVLPPQVISHAKLLLKQLEHHALSAQACCPREEVYAFLQITNLNTSVPEWVAISNRLSNWISLGLGQQTAALITAGHDPAVVFAASKAAEACYIHVSAHAQKVTELLAFGDSFVYVHPRIAWYVLATAMLDMVLYVLGSEGQSAAAHDRLAVCQKWFDSVSVRKSWPLMDVYRMGFYNFYSQSEAFRGAWQEQTANGLA
jgi:hypothetical protein